MPILETLFSAVSRFFGTQKKKSSRKSKFQKVKSRKSSLRRSAVKKKKKIFSSLAKIRPTRARSSSRKSFIPQRPLKKIHKPVPPQQKSVLKDEKKGILIGSVTHYFDKISVCVVNCSRGPLKIGDRIKISGKNTSFEQAVQSLQVESRDVKVAAKGQLVGLKVKAQARAGDLVYRQ